MKTLPPDPALSATLQRWRVAPPRAPDFRTAVWRRIQAVAARESWPTFVRARAAAWGVVALVAFVGAGFAGLTAARARVAADRASLATSYLVSLDPRAQAELRP